jgi:hypothetical protein
MRDETPKPRHKWVKLRLHVYLCRKCGTGYVNAQTAGGVWYRTYHRADGISEVSTCVPECAPGPRGARALQKYADAL